MPLAPVVAIACAMGLGRTTSNQRTCVLLALIMLVSGAQFTAGFTLLKLSSPDFREAAETQFGDTDIYTDCPQMGYYLTKNGVYYTPFTRDIPRDGTYLLLDRSNVDWLLEKAPQAELELLSRTDGLSSLRNRLKDILGKLDLHKVTITESQHTQP
jgi:hypothetical protein